MSAPTSYGFQWKRAADDIAGATSQHYKVQPADEGYHLSCSVTAVNSAGRSTPAASSLTSMVEAGASAPTRMTLAISCSANSMFTRMSDSGFAQFQAMNAAGVASLRFGIANTGSDEVSTGYSAMALAAKRAGLDSLLILNGYNTARSAAEFTTWCGDVAAFYSQAANGGIHYYEVCNEINESWNWGPGTQSTVNPAAYAALLHGCYAAVTAADPEAQVLFGSLCSSAGDGAPAGGGAFHNEVTPSTFLALAYEEMGGDSTGYFDIMNVHPYTYPKLPDESSWAWEEMFSPTGIPGNMPYPSVRAQMVSHGDAGKPIWITEMGAPTGTVGGYTSGEALSSAGEANQYTTSYSLLESNELNFVTRFYGYTWADDIDDFGLLTSTFQPKSFGPGSYAGQPSGVTTVLEAFSEGVTYSSAFSAE
jgi:hypothetical protein